MSSQMITGLAKVSVYHPSVGKMSMIGYRDGPWDKVGGCWLRSYPADKPAALSSLVARWVGEICSLLPPEGEVEVTVAIPKAGEERAEIAVAGAPERARHIATALCSNVGE